MARQSASRRVTRIPAPANGGHTFIYSRILRFLIAFSIGSSSSGLRVRLAFIPEHAYNIFSTHAEVGKIQNSRSPAPSGWAVVFLAPVANSKRGEDARRRHSRRSDI